MLLFFCLVWLFLRVGFRTRQRFPIDLVSRPFKFKGASACLSIDRRKKGKEEGV